jgi:hypothetical protein
MVACEPNAPSIAPSPLQCNRHSIQLHQGTNTLHLTLQLPNQTNQMFLIYSNTWLHLLSTTATTT